MRMVDIIIKKRDHHELSKEEIEFFIQGYTRDEIPDYQASALAMAIQINGMTTRETTDLTLAMAQSGEILDLSKVVKIAVDKHSTGGVGDKTSLVVAPTVASCGLPVGKMSGRGLGFSGGTLDKLESIPGFRSNLTTDEFIHQLKTIGIVLTGQSADLAPADGKLYALRDVTGTVQSIPLIASSIMSKKIAAGAQAILLDVKVGHGAFMTDLEAARRLGELMVEIGRFVGRRTVAILSDMNQPLGQAVGNSLEVQEALETLRGGGPEDFKEHCMVVSGYMLAMGGLANNEKLGKQMAEAALASGKAFSRFRDFIQAQGGDVKYVDHPDYFDRALFIQGVESPHSGYLAEINAKEVGEATVLLGCGRARKGDSVDYSVGVIVHHKVGDKVTKGDILFTVHANEDTKLMRAKVKMLAAHRWSDEPVKPLPLYYGTIS
ncbi:MAG: pyrimidine-nucleoside phosphorylase [Chloroflexi bacterium RBG_19FT_COMBO_47_9]|nr:MAG: pyrimidine-nucleoside phosphorylase [Chloroflexi bacterium RBG_19FT_COMBO_47_9]